VADLKQARRSRVLGKPWRILPKSVNSLIILKFIIFQETLSMKKLPKYYALVMQASNNIYLFVVSCEIKYATYIVGWRL
jgi:hypothetical protein